MCTVCSYIRLIDYSFGINHLLFRTYFVAIGACKYQDQSALPMTITTHFIQRSAKLNLDIELRPNHLYSYPHICLINKYKYQ